MIEANITHSLNLDFDNISYSLPTCKQFYGFSSCASFIAQRLRPAGMEEEGEGDGAGGEGRPALGRIGRRHPSGARAGAAGAMGWDGVDQGVAWWRYGTREAIEIAPVVALECF